MPIVIERRDPLTQAQGVEAGYAQTARRWPSQPLVRRPHTASELSGPRRSPAPAAVAGREAGDLAGHGTSARSGSSSACGRARGRGRRAARGHGGRGLALQRRGQVHPPDTHDAPVDPNFYGAARLSQTATEGSSCAPSSRARIRCPTPAAGGGPRTCTSRCGDGCGSRLVTQMFFPGEPLNASRRHPQRDPRPASARRCIARLIPSRTNELVYEHQLVVRGRNATAHAVKRLVPTAEMTLGPFFRASSRRVRTTSHRARPRRSRSPAASPSSTASRSTTCPRDLAGGRRRPLRQPGFPGWGRAATDARASTASAPCGRARFPGARRTSTSSSFTRA